MSFGQFHAPVLAAFVVVQMLVAGAVAAVLLRFRERRYPGSLVRSNVRGLQVPAILGDALVGGAFPGLLLLALLQGRVTRMAQTVAVALVLVVMWAAGAWDDRRGDERPRGFHGHLGALRSRSLTGGLLKIIAGMFAGFVAAFFLPAGTASPLAHAVETILLVGLAANLINLFDRAPGRAGKITLLVGVPLGLFGSVLWAVAAAPVFGALVYCLLPDMRERAMLGDAGANPLGAVLGVGLAASLAEPGRLVAIAILLALNLASERWSFSKAIEATPALRWFDGLGRKDQVASK